MAKATRREDEGDALGDSVDEKSSIRQKWHDEVIGVRWWACGLEGGTDAMVLPSSSTSTEAKKWSERTKYGERENGLVLEVCEV